MTRKHCGRVDTHSAGAFEQHAGPQRRLVVQGARALATLLLLAAGCGEPRRAESLPVEATSSRVDVFLRCTDPGGPVVALDLAGVSIRDSAGNSHPLVVQRKRVESREAAQRLAIAGAIVPRGDYQALVLSIAGAWLGGPGAPTALTLETAASVPLGPPTTGDAGQPYDLPIRLSLKSRDAASLFIDWSVSESLLGGSSFVPAFSTTLEKPRATLGLLYVADAASGSVLAVDPSSGDVVSTVKAGAGPSAVALSQSRQQLLVANAGDGSVTAIDVRSGTVEATFPIGFSAGTSDVVLTDADRLAAAANPGTDTVAAVDLIGRSKAYEIRVGSRPVRLAAAPRQRRLFVALAGADAVAVIDLNTRTLLTTTAVEAQPIDVAVDRDEKRLAVCHATSSNLLILDTRTLATQASVYVGNNGAAVLADRFRDRFFVSRSSPNEIAVVDTRMGSVVRRIPVPGRVVAMAQARDGGALYGVIPDTGMLVVVDTVVGRVSSSIPCGSQPLDVAIAD